MTDKGRFTSDRRVPSSSSWTDDSDWAAGVAEGVDVVGGGLVGRGSNRDGVIYYNSSSEGTDWQQGHTEIAGDVVYQKNTDHLRIRTPTSSSSTMVGTWEHYRKVDLGPYDELAVEWENNPSGIGSGSHFGYGSQFGELYAGDDGERINIAYESFNRKESVVNVSSVSGEWVVFVAARCSTYLNTSYSNDLRVYNVEVR